MKSEILDSLDMENQTGLLQNHYKSNDQLSTVKKKKKAKINAVYKWITRATPHLFCI